MDGPANNLGASISAPAHRFLRHFASLPDPRAANVVHRFSDILFIAIAAVLCGADGWVTVELWARSKFDWLKTILDLPAGIPSHDTFNRIFAQIDPDAFEQCFVAWVSSLKCQDVYHVAFDGKSLRRSFDHAWDKSGMVHLVSAYLADQELCFAQRATEGRGGELQALRSMIDLLDLSDAVVTIDALGTQKDVAQKLIEKRADYILPVKQNQPELHAMLTRLLDEAILEKFEGLSHTHEQTTDGNHGRIEIRRVWVSDDPQLLRPIEALNWCAVASVAVVESNVRKTDSIEPKVNRRYFITSLEATSADRIGQLVRKHWSIENNLHWQLDVSFREDDRRLRKNHSAENFSRLCRLALNLLKSEKTAKVGIAAKRLRAGWDHAYLLKLLLK